MIESGPYTLTWQNNSDGSVTTIIFENASDAREHVALLSALREGSRAAHLYGPDGRLLFAGDWGRSSGEGGAAAFGKEAAQQPVYTVHVQASHDGAVTTASYATEEAARAAFARLAGDDGWFGMEMFVRLWGPGGVLIDEWMAPMRAAQDAADEEAQT